MKVKVTTHGRNYVYDLIDDNDNIIDKCPALCKNLCKLGIFFDIVVDRTLGQSKVVCNVLVVYSVSHPRLNLIKARHYMAFIFALHRLAPFSLNNTKIKNISHHIAP
jgi:hypothetical protein